MAYKQTPGRGNMPKTGRGMSPALMGKSPMKQTDPKTGKKKAAAEIDKVFSENSMKVAAEAMAKKDSANVASAHMAAGMSKKMAARKGNKAANVTRSKNNVPNVIQGHIYGDPKTDSYWRGESLEKDVKKSTVNNYRYGK